MLHCSHNCNSRYHTEPLSSVTTQAPLSSKNQSILQSALLEHFLNIIPTSDESPQTCFHSRVEMHRTDGSMAVVWLVVVVALSDYHLITTTMTHDTTAYQTSQSG